ncbi:BREX-1 system adenine-specific DNA-methyltransferase PglX [Carnobacterium iners]|uniref:BREX-1 system adenine-specific DNA-methyltransferase PglX n=1 Tax=Carnobacterium iners TaxID=1073423 RepID=UPI000A1C8E91|nr:BREX-1 system adenine-specific DNA-methyltransferase PglX [Carnobacterium iners]
MDKTNLKTFAREARKKLIISVKQRAAYFKITSSGIDELQVLEGIKLVNGQPVNKKTSDYYTDLVNKIKLLERETNYKQAYEEVMEEVAYTWFNRLITFRFMEVHDYLPIRMLLLSSLVNGKEEPDALTDIGLLIDELNLEEKLIWSLQDDHNQNELFKYLLIQQSHQLGNLIPTAFEPIGGSEELLLPDNLLSTGSVVQDLVRAVEISNWQEVEVIGWLYQYYQSEIKEQVGGLKNYTVSKYNLATVTQLFTPKWIVRYMLQNSLGKLYNERYPSNELTDRFDYFLKYNKEEPLLPTTFQNLEDIRLVDPACGSGNILIEAFDLLYDMYLEQGYSPKEVPQYIIGKNLYGFEIDKRSTQISHISLFLKAVEKNPRIIRHQQKFDFHIYEYIDAVVEVSEEMLEIVFEEEEIERYRTAESKQENGKQFGTLITFPESYDDLLIKLNNFLEEKTEDLYIQAVKSELRKKVLPILNISHFLTIKYDVVCTNPPYHNKFNPILKKFMQQNYPSTKSDMYSAFIEKTFSMTKKNGYAALMTPYTWMFISSHEKLRKYIIENGAISSLVQLEYSAFEDATVPLCTLVLQNQHEHTVGAYVRLTEFKGGMNIQDKKIKEASTNKNCFYLFEVNQMNYKKIPGNPISYWIPIEKVSRIYNNNETLEKFVEIKKGLATGKVSLFIKYWHEISLNNFSIMIKNAKWYPCHKGGDYNKWYGNFEKIINWENNGEEIKNYRDNNGKLLSRPQNLDYMQKRGIVFSKITSGGVSCRIMTGEEFFDDAVQGMFLKDEKLYNYILALLNSKLSGYFLSFLNPTLNKQIYDLKRIPVIISENLEINKYTVKAVLLSKKDWDSFETSWDFEQHPFITYQEDFRIINDIFQKWSNVAKQRFDQLKENEEELNRLFIDIYGLQDELTPKIEDEDVTVRKTDLSRDVKSFLSYLVGVIFGRYSLDKPGLIYGGGDFELEQYQTYKPDKDNVIPITDEHYFEDDIVSRIIELVTIIFGEQTVEENLQFIAEALGMKTNENSREALRRYFMKDFFKDHKKIYQKRPIYWQMTSGKEDAFKGLIYLHRYETNTLARVRTDYVLPLTNTISELMRQAQLVSDGSDSSKEVAKAQKTKEKFQKQLQELRDYDLILKNLADQEIELDLDDGVKVNYEKFQNIPVTGTENHRVTQMNLLEKI